MHGRRRGQRVVFFDHAVRVVVEGQLSRRRRRRRGGSLLLQLLLLPRQLLQVPELVDLPLRNAVLVHHPRLGFRFRAHEPVPVVVRLRLARVSVFVSITFAGFRRARRLLLRVRFRFRHHVVERDAVPLSLRSLVLEYLRPLALLFFDPASHVRLREPAIFREHRHVVQVAGEEGRGCWPVRSDVGAAFGGASVGVGVELKGVSWR